MDRSEKEIAFMKRITLVLGMVAVMAAMMVALAAPAMAKDNDGRKGGGINRLDNRLERLDNHLDNKLDRFDNRFDDDFDVDFVSDVDLISDSDDDDYYWPYYYWYYPYWGGGLDVDRGFDFNKHIDVAVDRNIDFDNGKGGGGKKGNGK